MGGHQFFGLNGFPGPAGTDITAIAPTTNDAGGASGASVTLGSAKADGSGNLVTAPTGTTTVVTFNNPSPASGEFDATVTLDLGGGAGAGLIIEPGGPNGQYYVLLDYQAGLVLNKAGGSGWTNLNLHLPSIISPATINFSKRLAAGGQATLTATYQGTTATGTDTNPNPGGVACAAGLLDSSGGSTYLSFAVSDPPAATATLAGPATGTAGVESAACTVTLDHPAGSGGQSVNLASDRPGDAFRRTSGGPAITALAIPDGQLAATFLTVPGSNGTEHVAIAAPGLTVAGTPLAFAVGPPAPPTVGPITVTTDGTVDTITYPAPIAGNLPVASAWLFVGNSAGGESPTAVATVAGSGAGTFTHATAAAGGTNYYVVRVLDTQGNPSAPSNEVSQAGPAGTGGGANPAQVAAIVNAGVGNTVSLINAYMAAIFTPSRIAAIDTLAAQQALADIPANIKASLRQLAADGAALTPTIAVAPASLMANAEEAATGLTPIRLAALDQLAASQALPDIPEAVKASLRQVIADGATVAPSPTMTPAEGSLAAMGGTAATTATSIKEYLDEVGPLADAVGILTGYYVLTTDGQTVIEYNRQGIEIDRYPAVGRTAITLPAAVTT